MGGGALPGRPKIRQWLGRIGQLPDWLCGTSVLSTGRRGEGRGVRLPCSQVVCLDSPRSLRPPLSPPTPQHTHTQRLRKPGSSPWCWTSSEASGWASPSVSLARGGWGWVAGAVRAPAGLHPGHCAEALPSARRKPRWFGGIRRRGESGSDGGLRWASGRGQGAIWGQPMHWDQPHRSQLCSLSKVLWLRVLDSKWDCPED